MHKITVISTKGKAHIIRCSSLARLLDLYEKAGADPWLVTPDTIQIGKRSGDDRRRGDADSVFCRRHDTERRQA